MTRVISTHLKVESGDGTTGGKLAALNLVVVSAWEVTNLFGY